MQTSEKQTKKIIKRTHRTNKKMEKKNQTFASARAAGKRRADCRRTWQTESKSIEAYPILDTLTHTHTLAAHVCRHFDLAMGSGSSP